MDTKRNIERVRELLKHVDDSPSAKHENSFNAIAEDYGITTKALKKFRDGDDRAISKQTINVWSQLIGTDTGPYAGNYQSPEEWFNNLFGKNADRNAKFDQYDIMRKTRGEVDSAASVWADMVCTGAISEENRYCGGFIARMEDSANKKASALLMEIGKHINNYIVPTTTLHQIVHDTVVYGNQYEQLAFAKRGEGTRISKLVPMPIRQTRLVDPDSADKMYGWFTRPSDTEPSDFFPSWRIAHFANRKSRADEEGVSVFDSSLRVWVQVESSEGGMLTRRLERAPMRYKWTVDTSGCKDLEARHKEVNRHREENRKVRTIDTDAKFQKYKISLTAGEDLYVGKSNKDSPADVDVLDGDPHLGDIADFDHFFNRFLAGLGPPKHHLGYEQDTMRSVGTDLTIVFARKARRIQMQVARTLNHFYWVELLLQGIDPREMDYLIIPPTLGTRDELVRAQVLQAHATTCRYLAEAFALSGSVPTPAWFLRYVMGMDDTAIEALKLLPVQGKGAGIDIKPSQKLTPSESSAMREKLNQNEAVASELRWTSYLLNERTLAAAPVSYLTDNHILSYGDFIPAIDVETFRIAVAQSESLAQKKMK